LGVGLTTSYLKNKLVTEIHKKPRTWRIPWIKVPKGKMDLRDIGMDGMDWIYLA
jgi:hypothetical protein